MTGRFTIRICQVPNRLTYYYVYKPDGTHYAIADDLQQALQYVDWYHRSYRRLKPWALRDFAEGRNLGRP